MVEVIRNLINQSDKTLFDIKTKLKEEKNKNLLKVQEQLPTREEIISRIKAETCNTETSNAVDKNYNNIKDKLDFIKNKLNKGIQKLESLNQKTLKIQGWIDKIGKLLDFLNPIINILKIIIKVLPLSLNFLSGLLANGFAIKKLGDLIDIAKSKIEVIIATTTTFRISIKKWLNSILPPIFNIITKAIAALLAIIAGITSLTGLLEQLYLFYQAQCNLPSNPVNADGSINEDVLNTVINGLEQGGKDEIIEKIYNANFETIGYRRYKDLN
jgi:hypothetical protein